MPNPYDHLFGNEQEKPQPASFGVPPPQSPLPSLPTDSRDDYPEPSAEPLDEVLEKINAFQQRAEHFSRLLSQTNAVEHEVTPLLFSLLVETKDRYQQPHLTAEKAYHELLRNKFRLIIEPMRALAELHLDTVRQFNNDIDKHYFSVEKEQVEVNSDKDNAVDGLNLQRKILADAAGDLRILEGALEACERRLNKYVDAGGSNNLSRSELALLVRNREALTGGLEHQFNYPFFKVNLLDKAAMALGFYQKETTAQYLQKLGTALTLTDGGR